MYNPDASNDTPAVFEYVVQAGDPITARIIVLSGFLGDAIYGVYTNGEVTDVQPQAFWQWTR